MMKKKKWVASLILTFILCTVFFAVSGFATEIEQVTRLSVTKSDQTFAIVGIDVDGIPPWNIGTIDILGPNGAQDSWGVYGGLPRWASNYNHQQGTSYLFRDYNLQHDIDGKYDVILTAEDGTVYSKASDDYIFNEMPRVDISLATPADLATVSTVTPTFVWSAVTSSTTTTPYYRVDVYKMEEDSPLYRSDLTTATTFIVPATYAGSGFEILEDTMRYKWRVFAFDGPTVEESANLSISDFNVFYIEKTDNPPAFGYCEAYSRLKAGQTAKSRFSGTIKNVIPTAVKVQLKNSSEEIIHTFEDLANTDSSGFFVWYPDNNDEPLGKYTFEMLNPETGVVYDSCEANYQPNWGLTPVDDILAPEDESVFPTETPTFSWMPVAEATEYKITISSYSGDVWVYSSAKSAATTVQIPVGYLKKNSAYQARVSAYDVNGNRTDSEWNDFFIGDDKDPAQISGTISAGTSGYVDGGTVFVVAFRSHALYGDDDRLLGMSAVNHMGAYTIHNMPTDTDVYIYALWDKNNDGDISPGDWEGWHSDSAIQLTTTGTTPGVDISLDVVVEEVSISGDITIDDFKTGYGQIYIGVFEEDDTHGDPIKVVAIPAPGAYTVDGLVKNMQYSVTAYWDIDNSGSDGPTPGDSESEYGSNPIVTTTDITGIDISLEVGGVVRGTITSDGSTGIVNLHVYFEDATNYNYMGGTNTDANGDYTFALPPGTYHVNACPQCSGNPYVNQTVADVVVASLQPGEVDFTLEAGGSICGKITTDGVSPLNNIHVYFQDSTTNDYQGGTHTDMNGEYCYMLSPGSSYTVTACPTCDNHSFVNETHPSPVSVSLNTTVDNIDFELTQGGQVCGTITDELSNPLSNIDVTFKNDAQEDAGLAITDSNGQYCYILPEATYSVTACPSCTNENFLDQTYSAPVEVKIGIPVDSIDISLVSAHYGEICGLVTDGTSALNNIHVYFVDSGTDEYKGGVNTDSSGAYCYFLPPGSSYTVNACPSCDNQNYEDKTYSSAVAVSSDLTVNGIDFELDIIDQCLADPDKTEPGQCGCGTADTDTDGDGTADCNDGCVNDPDKTILGQCGCGTADTDTDGDGVFDCEGAEKFPWTMFLPAIISQGAKWN